VRPANGNFESSALFVLLVANISGALSPLGDPPLFVASGTAMSES
jgi:Na+/H+ antiporter NhaD/arsenite permease-like protein